MRKIVVLCGSESDLGQITSGLALLQMAEEQGLAQVLSVEICSAHRNPVELNELLWDFTNEKKADVVIMCAGKLAALFGNCDSISRNEMGNNFTNFIAVPLRGKTEESSKAAYLAAKEVPNSQFIFQEEFFHNPEKAFEYAINGDLPEITLGNQKPPQKLSLYVASCKGRRKYPEKASYEKVIRRMEYSGFIHMYTGKTRETFLNPDFPDLLYVLATDRISIFDKVLNMKIPGKGAILTATTVFWLKKAFPHVPNHLVAYGSGVMDYLPKKMYQIVADGISPHYLMKNMLVVKRTEVLKVEAIMRGYLTGSGLKDYKKTGKVCGIELPEGLIDGSELPFPIFTPSTKADYGLHDENISFEKAVEIVGEGEAQLIMKTSKDLYVAAKASLSSSKIILADTKFEFGKDPDGNILLIDEVLTPDSSRFWPEGECRIAMQKGQTPPSFDKQGVRDAGEAAGIKTTNPDWTPSEELIVKTIRKYIYMFEVITGEALDNFWREEMGFFG